MRHLLGLLLVTLISAPLLAAPAITRDEIIAIAKSGVGSRYIWGGGCWDPKRRSWKGADCSGFAAKAWQIPSRSATTACSHPYSTYNFYNQSTHWTHLSRNELKKGDALVYRSGSGGHIVVYASGDKWGTAEVYEARGRAYGIIHRMKSVESKYKAIRRRDLTPPKPPAPSRLDAALVAQSASALPASGGAKYSLCPRQRFSFRFELKNIGDVTWSDVNASEKGKAVRLGFRGGASFGLANRLSVNKASKSPVRAGEKTVFSFSATAPSQTGVKNTQWQLVSELVAWFGPKVSLRFNVTAKPPGHGKACQTKGLGECKPGTMTCGAAGLSCQAVKRASAERCDGKDNDCDGEVDEGGVCGGGIEPGSGSKNSPSPGEQPTGPTTTPPVDFEPGQPPPLLDPGPRELRGGCSLSNSAPTPRALLLLLTLGLIIRRGRR